MYQKFWKQFLIEQETAGPTFKFNADEPTSPDPIVNKQTGIKAYLSDSDFYVDTLLGSGADGKVYRIADKKTGRKMALKVISPSTAKGHGQDLEREVKNYKFLMNNRASFGQKAKYFPVVYRTGLVDIPKPFETIDGRKERAGLIFMEELEPLPDDLVKKLFAMSGKVKGSNLSQRDKILFKNEKLVKNFLTLILQQARIVTSDKIDKIVNNAVKLYSDFSISPNMDALLATENETKKELSRYGVRLFATLLQSIIKYDSQAYEDEKKLFKSFAVSLNRPFKYNYRRPLKTTDTQTREKSVYVGFDEEFDEEGYVDSNFPEAENLKKQVQAFEELGISFFDVHSKNVMMRPDTKDIVIVDVGRFNM
tara:strand:+ start:1103 stop:2200 length:1098 start_codon:yes stop_codon:yes gene_type:complete